MPVNMLMPQVKVRAVIALTRICSVCGSPLGWPTDIHSEPWLSDHLSVNVNFHMIIYSNIKGIFHPNMKTVLVCSHSCLLKPVWLSALKHRSNFTERTFLNVFRIQYHKSRPLVHIRPIQSSVVMSLNRPKSHSWENNVRSLMNHSFESNILNSLIRLTMHASEIAYREWFAGRSDFWVLEFSLVNQFINLSLEGKIFN